MFKISRKSIDCLYDATICDVHKRKGKKNVKSQKKKKGDEMMRVTMMMGIGLTPSLIIGQ